MEQDELEEIMMIRNALAEKSRDEQEDQAKQK
jgi:hypothetical protein